MPLSLSAISRFAYRNKLWQLAPRCPTDTLNELHPAPTNNTTSSAWKVWSSCAYIATITTQPAHIKNWSCSISAKMPPHCTSQEGVNMAGPSAITTTMQSAYKPKVGTMRDCCQILPSANLPHPSHRSQLHHHPQTLPCFIVLLLDHHLSIRNRRSRSVEVPCLKYQFTTRFSTLPRRSH